MTEFLVGILNTFNGWFGSYAIAIVLFTLMIKVVLLPLDIMQRKNMRRNLELQPKLDGLKKKYGKDPQKLQEKTMELYKQEKFNPFMGCLPMLLQFPVLIIMFNAIRLLADSQLAIMFDVVSHGGDYVPQAFLWVHNLWQPDNISSPVYPTMQAVSALRANNNLNLFSAYDGAMKLLSTEHVAMIRENYETVMAPLVEATKSVMNGYAILPILSAGVSFLSSKLMPQQPQPDAAQANAKGAGGAGNMMKYMNYFMPLMMAYFCWTSSAAFAIYWVASSVIEIGKQLVFRVMFPDPNKARNGEGDGKVVVVD